ncbi:hypothetical protein JCGZ_26532 [Jatropha curcas]|uniref:Aminotransferase-like plant mobile domain-containing protein n=1 Tax=Jatropha curcas TaxID=180498 RepID=A0A067L834_JATCU|nr:hypothetical protein JCGZ_26532 [Jatropha curcas]
MTLTPADFTAITGLGFDGDVVPLDSRYQTAALGAELVAILLGVTTCTSLEGATCRCQACAPTYTREERDQAARSFIFYIISSQLLCTSQNNGDPAVLACLRELSLVDIFDWASLALAHLYHGLDVWTRGSGESNWPLLRPLEVWAYEYQIYPRGPKSYTLVEARWIPRYLVHRHHTNSIAKDPHYWRRYLNNRALADLFLTPWEGDAWTAYAPRVRVEALTRSRVLLQGYWLDQYYLGERVLEIRTTTSQRRVPVAPPRHMCTLDGMTPEDRLLEYSGFPADDYLVPGDYSSYLSTQLQTRLPDVREYSQDRKRHRTPTFYEAQAEVSAPTGPTGVVLSDVPFPPGMEVTLDPSLGLGLSLAIPADLRQAPPQLQLDPDHATHALQAAAVSHLQMENDRLRTRLEVEGIPLDFSDEEEDDDDDTSSDDAPPLPPSSVKQAAAGPSRRQR